MKRDDTLDRTRWKAWSWGATPEDFELAEKPPEPEPAGETETESAPPSEEDRAVRRALLDDYAANVEDAWRRRADAEASELVPIVRKAVDIFNFIGLSKLHPSAAVRAARLLVSLWNDRKARQELDFVVYGLTFGSVQHPEVVDLLIEVTRSGHRKLMSVVSRMLDDEDLAALYPSLGQKVAFELESARSWNGREFALAILSEGGWNESIPWLRKALRWPHLGCRIMAIEGLVSLGAMTEEDVSWLVDDAFVHPIDPPSGRSDEPQFRYERSLKEAVLRVRPASAVATLTRLAKGEGALIQRDRRHLERAWALECLAHLDPTLARDLIDRSLREDRAYARHNLVAACAALPESDARPRLLRLASELHHYVATTASEAWEKRFGEACPADALSGLSTALLDGAPSSEFEARARVLKGQDEGARRAMIGVVLASPPSRETLVLTLAAMRLGTYGIEGAPSGAREWIDWLRERYGELAFEALRLEADRERECLQRFEELAALAAEGALPERDERLVRARVLAEFDAADEPDTWTHYAAVRLLPHPDVLARFEAMLARPLPSHLAYLVVRAFEKHGPDAALDARLAARFFAAHAEGDWSSINRYGSVCIARGVEAVISACLDDVWSVDAPEATEALDSLYSALHDAKRLPDERIVEGLADPHAPRFVRMSSYVPKDPEMLSRAVERLRAALAPEVSASVAAEALWTLLRMELMSPDEPIVAEVYERAPDEAKSRILDMRIGRELRDGRRWQTAISALLLGEDEKAISNTLDTIYFNRKAEWDDVWIDGMIAVLPKGRARDIFLHLFKRPTEAEMYWVRDDESDDEGSDESDDESDEES